MRAVLFDLDDTLYPEIEFVRSGFAAAASYVARRHGLDPTRAARRMMELLHSDGRGRIFDRFLEELDLDFGAEASPTMLYIYRTHHPVLAPYPDVSSVLNRLADAGLRLGVLTGGLASVQRRKLDALELGVTLDAVVIVGELPTIMAKPAAAPFRVAIELLDVPSSEITYVGNDPYKDFAGAREAGMHTIRVRVPSDTFPVAVDAGLEDADQYVDPFEAIVDVLLTA
jgi:putative hydrolase of the HAD superfamily